MVTLSWASDLEQLLPWLIAVATVTVAIGLGALLVSHDPADEQRRPAQVPVRQPPDLPRQRRGGMSPRGL